MPKVVLVCYHGMKCELTTGDKAACRAHVAGLLRSRRRQEYPVSTLARGKEWEVETPGHAALVGDSEGIVSIKEGWYCDFCGEERFGVQFKSYDAYAEDCAFCDGDCCGRYIDAEEEANRMDEEDEAKEGDGDLFFDDDTEDTD